MQPGLRATELEIASALHLARVLGDPWVAERAEDTLEESQEEDVSSSFSQRGPSVDLTG